MCGRIAIPINRVRDKLTLVAFEGFRLQYFNLKWYQFIGVWDSSHHHLHRIKNVLTALSPVFRV